MATITVLKFDSPQGANETLETVKNLALDHLVQLQDAAVVSWESGKKRPKTRQLADLRGTGALNGAFWGMLFGLIFFVPFLGAAIGAASGALAGSLADVGIGNDFIRRVRESVTEGTSCLFLMTADATPDKVVEAMKKHKFEIVYTNLTQAQEDKLREAFADEA